MWPSCPITFPPPFWRSRIDAFTTIRASTPGGILRAFAVNLKEGAVVEGGSTITQQLAKLAFLSSDRTYARKAQEFLLAFWLEGWLSKDEILSRYLSSVYFGDNIYGLRAAANHYFSRAPEKLSVEQAAMLAGLMKAPSRLAPTVNLKGARERGDVVEQAMVDAGFLTEAQARRLPRVVLKRGTGQGRADRHLFRRLGLPRRARLCPGGLWRAEDCDHA
jgi:membrane peptidoglycan carboxypeptidase